MARKSRFKPPPVESPPALVQVFWIDAVQAHSDEVAATEAGGLFILPSAGYHVRTGTDKLTGPFVVLAREYTDSQGTIIVRDTHTIPVGWILRWSKVTGMTQIYPPEV